MERDLISLNSGPQNANEIVLICLDYLLYDHFKINQNTLLQSTPIRFEMFLPDPRGRNPCVEFSASTLEVFDGKNA